MKRRFIYTWYTAIPYIGLIAAGGINTAYIGETKKWAWGANDSGQLGDNSIIDKITPTSILGANKTFCRITGGSNTTIGIDKNGLVWAWGNNALGQLGINSTTSRRTPVSVLGANKTFCQIDMGGGYSLGIDKNGLVWAWGYNNNGQLGDNSITNRCTPTSILGANKTFCQIAGGGNTTIGIDKNGLVWAWGNNQYGQLGINSATSRRTPTSILGANKTFCQIAVGGNSTVCIDKNGLVWAWGWNQYGQLGDNSITSRLTPVSILGAKKTFCQIAGGSYHTVGIDNNGMVWGWGSNGYGQLGDNSNVGKFTPVSILGVKKIFCKIAGGGNTTIGIDNNGHVWAWGHNRSGQLGNNNSGYRCTPVSILGANKTFCQITSTAGQVLGIDFRGLVWGWGANNNFQLGTNSYDNKCTPVSILGANKTFCTISDGNTHTIGIDKNGLVWAWGSNSYGQLGVNSTANKVTPTSIFGAIKTFCQIVGGTSNTMGLDFRGLVWGWGYNGQGQLGNNTITSRRTPVSILGANKTFCQIDSGANYTVGVDKNGLVWAWGHNSSGQLGDNTITSRRTPISVLGAKKTFCKISGGSSHSLGIDKNGLVWAWGYNGYGQIGNNSAAYSHTTPVSILGAKKTFCQIAGGDNHSVGIDFRGRVWDWGNNQYGQLGDNSITSRLTPVSILGANKTFCRIAGGSVHTVGIDNNGMVWGWGFNQNGQLGYYYNSITPVRVCNL